MSAASVLWRRLDLPGHEVADVTREGERWVLRGIAVFAHEGRPHRLEYAIACDLAWRTEHATISGSAAGSPLALEVARSAGDAWRVNGEERPALAGCEDVDLGFSPITNMLPIRRLGLGVGQSAPVRAAWVRFPGLVVAVLEQVYTRTGADTYTYESRGGAFRRELTVDATGIVLEYPDFWRAEARSGDVLEG